MKLLNCLDCNDVIAIYKDMRHCLCGKSSAKVDNSPQQKAIVYGNARILGMRNDEYFKSMTENDPNKNYRWFLIK